jgi:hypothetical protein
MPVKSSLNSISTLNLWLDATDLSTITTTTSAFDVRRWNDKSSNAYTFVPIRPGEPPKVSTNNMSSVAVLFDQVSSFQLVSQQKIPATSTLDFYAVVTPYSLWGPRAPIFDSADITLSETDTRFNTQIYADGNEFFRQIPIQSSNCAGATIYKGDLYIGSYVQTASNVNYLQKYNSYSRIFDTVYVPMTNSYTHALGVYNGNIYTAGGQITAYYSGGWLNTNYGSVEYWDGISTSFVSTTYISTFPAALTVHKRQLYTFTTSGWNSLYINNNTNTLATQNLPQMYVLSTNVFNWVADTNIDYNLNNTTYDWTRYTSNVISYRGDLMIAGSNSLSRYTNQNTFIPYNLTGSIYGYLSVYLGNLIVPYYNDTRIFRWNDNSAIQELGRWTYTAPNGLWIASGGMITYKGSLYGIFAGGGGGNVIQSFSDNGSNGTYLTKQYTGVGNCNLMIVHDGKLFIQNCNYNTITEYGNGISLDQSFSTLVGSPILVNIRKTPGASQLYLNGILVQTKYTDFTFFNQSNRQMWIGGAAGLMTSGLSDSGSDHFQGAIHTIVQYSSNLNTSDRQKVEGILAWTYGINNVLPASHPYATSSP